MSRTTHAVHTARGRHDQRARLERRARIERALRRGVEVVYDMTPDNHHAYIPKGQRQ